MADSNITKRALATAMRELMEEIPFEKINVAHICDKCGMNRKSFYYHFKDKYDLINWIFDTEFVGVAVANSLETSYDKRFIAMINICNYFYENQGFYRKALQIKGQNSFRDHFQEYIRPLLYQRLSYFVNGDIDDFTLDFMTDATMCAMERWLLDKDCMPPEQFIRKIKILVEAGAMSIHRQMEQREDVV